MPRSLRRPNLGATSGLSFAGSRISGWIMGKFTVEQVRILDATALEYFSILMLHQCPPPAYMISKRLDSYESAMAHSESGKERLRGLRRNVPSHEPSHRFILSSCFGSVASLTSGGQPDVRTTKMSFKPKITVGVQSAALSLYLHRRERS